MADLVTSETPIYDALVEELGDPEPILAEVKMMTLEKLRFHTKKPQPLVPLPDTQNIPAPPYVKPRPRPTPRKKS